MTDPMIEFVLARIAEREQAAQRAGGVPWLHRSIYRHPESEQEVYGANGPVANVECLYGWHIALNDPAHVLARCAADRAIVQEYTTALTAMQADPSDMSARVAAFALQLAVRHLANANADHPDFWEEWKS